MTLSNVSRSRLDYKHFLYSLIHTVLPLPHKICARHYPVFVWPTWLTEESMRQILHPLSFKTLHKWQELSLSGAFGMCLNILSRLHFPVRLSLTEEETEQLTSCYPVSQKGKKVWIIGINRVKIWENGGLSMIVIWFTIANGYFCITN